MWWHFTCEHVTILKNPILYVHILHNLSIMNILDLIFYCTSFLRFSPTTSPCLPLKPLNPREEATKHDLHISLNIAQTLVNPVWGQWGKKWRIMWESPPPTLPQDMSHNWQYHPITRFITWPIIPSNNPLKTYLFFPRLTLHHPPPISVMIFFYYPPFFFYSFCIYNVGSFKPLICISSRFVE
jgi:hypothetical protein